MAASVPGRAFFCCALAMLPGCGKQPLDAVQLDPDSIESGLIAHYTFDEGAGTAMVDHSGNKRDGVIMGSQWLEDGVFGGAIHFSGTETDYATVAEFPNASANYSVSIWTRASFAAQDEDSGTLLSTEVPFAGGWELSLNRFTNGIGVHAGYWDTVTMTYVFWECVCLPEGRWTHVAFVRDSTAQMLTVYVDGSPVGEVSAPNPISPGEAQLFVGRWQGDARYLAADLDDVAIYSRALAPAEIAELGTRPAPEQQ
ncbi:MAG TPA: LamG domain-containing protein [Polyangiaceae bacterium]|jgi:hypothetical protein|nr:LamG domain-containing protein [Polyangiaceae bacterium]